MDDGKTRGPEQEVFCFERGAFFSGSLVYKIIQRGEELWFIGGGRNRFAYLGDVEFQVTMDDLAGLIKALKLTAKWEANYEPVGVVVMDGFNWSIECDFPSYKKHTKGYEAYPYNYRYAIKRIQGEIEKLLKKYSDYREDEGMARMNLIH